MCCGYGHPLNHVTLHILPMLLNAPARVAWSQLWTDLCRGGAGGSLRVYLLLPTNTLKEHCLALFLWVPVLGIPVGFLFVTRKNFNSVPAMSTCAQEKEQHRISREFKSIVCSSGRGDCLPRKCRVLCAPMHI